MITNNNSQLSQEIRDVTRLQNGKDIMPSEIGHIIQPVIDVNPKHARVINSCVSKTSNGTVLTTPTDRDYYFVGCSIGASNTTAATAATATIAVTPKGGSSVVVAAAYPRTGAVGDSVAVSTAVMLPIPILLERGTNILFAQGNVAIGTCCVFGYVIDNSGA